MTKAARRTDSIISLKVTLQTSGHRSGAGSWCGPG